MDDLIDSAHASHANSLIAPCEIITRGPSDTVGTCLRYTWTQRCMRVYSRPWVRTAEERSYGSAA